jgi:hypothetical protein
MENHNLSEWRKTGVHRSDFPATFFDLVPQGGVRVTMFPTLDPQPNSIWDLLVTSQGRVFAPLCSELAARRSAMLYEYRPDDGGLELCFDVAPEVSPLDGAIIPSKIHSCMSEMEDGRIIMATHTTVAAKDHPAWLFPHYYDHPWEGFQGSNLLIYAPATGALQNLGVPVPRDTIYGGCYDPKHRAFYFGTYLRGHFYRYDLKSRSLTDLGQCSELGSFRFVRASDGHIYFSTRSGWISRINTDSGKPELFDARIPSNMRFCAEGRDGCLYVNPAGTDIISVFDPKTGRILPEREKSLGTIFPPSIKSEVMAMAFDERGALWFALAVSLPSGLSAMIHLGCWDVAGNAAPVNFGMLGTPDRNPACASEMHIHDGMLLLADTNHCDDAPALFQIDLARIKADFDKPRIPCQDPLAYYYLEDGLAHCEGLRKRIHEFDEGFGFMINVQNKTSAANPYFVRAAKAELVRLWNLVPPEESAVRSLRWDGDGRLHGTCGTKERRSFLITEGVVSGLDLVPVPACENDAAVASATFAHLDLPGAPGRQRLARAVCSAPWSDGRQLVGTADGYLALVDALDGRVKSLGAVVACGPIRQIVSNPSGTRAYGVAGDERGVGIVFCYDAELGLHSLGWVGGEHQHLIGGPGHSSELSCLALSPDERILAVGAADRLGGVYLFTDVVIPGTGLKQQ